MSESRVGDAALRRLATLAGLELDSAEATTLARELTDILDFVSTLDAFATGADPFASVAASDAERWRDDVPRPASVGAPLVEAAPERQDSFFVVPPVLPEG